MIIDVTGKLILDARAREWCLLPYPGHPKGCPNYGQREQCPPEAPLVDDFIDLDMSHYFVVDMFDLKSHVERMVSLHPEWSLRQARCVLYWQGTARKRLKRKIADFIGLHPGMVHTLIPEAMGINVINTAKKLGILIETRPKDTVFKIALLGYPNNVDMQGTLDVFTKSE